MPKLNIDRTRKYLQEFDFSRLFTEVLGWSQPVARKTNVLHNEGKEYRYRHVAELSGVVVLEVTAEDGAIPPAKTRQALYRQIAGLFHENLLIFVDAQRTQSLWYWVKREEGKTYPREHLYVRGQPGDLFVGKLSAMVFDISRFDVSGNVSIVEVANSLKNALDVERVTKKFYTEYEQERTDFTNLIQGIPDDRERRWYASVLLHRLMFIYFLQRKFFLDNGREDYLKEKLAQARLEFGPDHYYRRFLRLLFFEGFAKQERDRSEEAKHLLGSIVYLNGGLFLEHTLEERYPGIQVPDRAFENLYALFERYSWNLNDTPGGDDDEINPDVLGYIFEKYINQKEFGAYYTRPEITEYLCEQTIHQLILDRINPPDLPSLPPSLQEKGVFNGRRFTDLGDLILHLDADLCRRLLDVLPKLSLLDPACGSGAFLVAAMRTLINVYSAVTGKIEYLSDQYLKDWLAQTRHDHRSLNYHIKRKIITENLFGVDIMPEACDIARLRLFLALVSSAQTVDELEPLPNIDFNIQSGNSLIGLLRVEEGAFDAQAGLFDDTYRHLVDEKNRKIKTYRDTSTYHKDLHALRDDIQKMKDEAAVTLNNLLLDEFGKLGVKYEQATWDDAKGTEGKPVKRPLTLDDIRALEPFHWGYEFDEVLNLRKGFDAIITNPPWEIFKPNSKEFSMEYSELVTINKMTIKEFEKEQAELLRKDDVRAAWLEYLSRFPHVSAYYRSTKQYENQISVVNGKKAGTDINLYKLFTEQCYNLLRPGGQCGIVIPSGIYTDLGTKQLRELLFEKTLITGLFGFENRRIIFENVDSRFKFVVLTFRKGGRTESFPTAFMRHDVKELETFPERGALPMPVELVRRLSPGSLSLMEFRSELDICIVEKMYGFPQLSENIQDSWNLILGREFDMSNDSKLFVTEPVADAVPLVQGGMIHQFQHDFAPPKYWISEVAGRRKLLGKQNDESQKLPYQDYRLAHRRIASNTNNRTLIACVLPPNQFCADTAQPVRNILPYKITLFITGIFNSFVMDAEIRKRVTTHCDMHFMYALRVPRLTERDAAFGPIVERAARLVCTTPEFDDLAREVGLGSHQNGATNPVERARLRAELDGLIAHLYGLTEVEFAHILSTFPLVPDPVKVAAQNAYQDVTKGLIR